MKSETKIVLGLAAGFATFGFLKSKLVTPNLFPAHQLGEKMVRSCVVAPVKEEIIFRHFGNNTYAQVFGERTGKTMSSALFAYGHRQPEIPLGRSAFHVLDAFVGALAYTYAYEVGGLAGSIGVHAAHNAGVMVGAARWGA